MRQAGPVSTYDGQRLATWIEELGLSAYLAEAGLPTFTRDETGAATWTDPATDEPMSADQLAALDQILHSDGTEPEHAVPVALVLLARQARVRRELLASPWFTYETLAELRGAELNATRFAVHKAASTHRLLVVPIEERSVVPAFQLGADGELRPELVGVLEPLLTARMDPWRAWAWLTQPAALTFGQAPERLAADPESADLVIRAAERLAEKVGS